MTVYYVGSGGNDGNAGTSWALRKLTLTGAEDIPVAAGDTVYVGPGTYRETLTVDVSGSGGSPITYIGDYSGVNTDGVGGVVRVTGSDNDQTATRANAVTATSKNYRTFRRFTFDLTTDRNAQSTGGGTNWVIDECTFSAATSYCLEFQGAGGGHAVSNCLFMGSKSRGLNFWHSSTFDNAANVVSNSIFTALLQGVTSDRVGGVTVKNCIMIGCNVGIRVQTALSGGQTLTVNKCIVQGTVTGFQATVLGELVENYNDVFANNTDRTNVSAGANSLSYAPLLDCRWLCELVSGSGRMLSPFDLASYSQLVNVAGTSPSATDMRGTSVIGANREIGALEYDPALLFRRVIARQV